ncbi:hypothetical protein PQS31_02210 [Luteimonas sp BLCC-B24]|uniref:hypothetical protein n=1 Tax=Luteimonas sp. BLCC-B24 TaxID=3025317 RepID=UPI00234D076A|nr:hypothetical protein [Luteimonas sp. BLCC-B24]MDC7805638.1 hypothetical protein [Luteimonas sp. BLCC-B24]
MQFDLRRRRLLQACTLAALASALPGYARTRALDATTTAEQATAGLDLRGRTIVVTGCTRASARRPCAYSRCAART